ncbi:MAG: FtsX-like permease family protein [Paludisphaera borealis]|uniref:ABC transporter permease n=1 Tax=Paludisphaera borealis TaxID=1387353 RepID=UPI00284FCA18|nr:FtsX-like permease family protein [Paludisphaera borealis]MDR3623279.1 FtsX-like permease family protein [Paludisphaera borealis]
MYKYLLCWRYLRTRYIALASIISVTLGVATMIVVNSVMAGFADKMRDRLHGVLADVIVESASLEGFTNGDEVMARIIDLAKDDIAAMAPTMETPGILKFRLGSESQTHPVQIIGVNPEQRAKTGDFAEFLFDDKGNKIPPSFEVPEALRAQSPAGMRLKEMETEGGKVDAFEQVTVEYLKQQQLEQMPKHGAIIGYAIGTYHRKGLPDFYLAPPGTKIGLFFPKHGKTPEAGNDVFTVVGYFKSGMSEYDSTHVYVPLEQLQQTRLLVDPEGRGAVNQIQIKVQPGVDIDKLADKIGLALESLRPMYFRVSTWEQKQGPLLAAVAIEQSILNILLFMIIAVAGFGILAIFSMIVVEKTRDIGILKALGASTSGIRNIFLGYGLLLGAVGSGVGMVGGLLFVRYINEIEKLLSYVLKHKVFDDSVYYFDRIPTLVEPRTVVAIVLGALFIAVVASIWPAQRAAKMHPVKALRFE